MIIIHSFPRCGNHFFRYCVEYLTGFATIGCVGFTDNPNEDSPICFRSDPEYLDHVNSAVHVAQKAHFVGLANNILARHPNSGLILLLRDPIENLMAHRLNEFPDRINYHKKDVQAYLENLNFYDSFEGKKAIVLYEDMVYGDPLHIIRVIENFFDIDQDRKLQMLADFDKFRNDSMKSPHRKPTSLSSPTYYREKIQNTPYNEYVKDCTKILYKNALVSNYYKYNI